MAITSLTITNDRTADTSWRKRAACRDTDTAIFFADNGDHQKAIGICDECPVRTACLEWALANNEQHGIWGGLTKSRRNKLRSERRAAAGLPVRPAPGRGTRGEHGTRAGYRNHFRVGTPPCEACRKGDAREREDEAAARRNGPSRAELAQNGWCTRCINGDHHRCRFCTCPECHPTTAEQRAC